MPSNDYYVGGQSSGLSVTDHIVEEAKQDSAAPAGPIQVTLYSNGFTVNDGPFRDYNSPANAQFMDQGRTHQADQRQSVDVALEDKRQEEFTPPPYTAFSGGGGRTEWFYSNPEVSLVINMKDSESALEGHQLLEDELRYVISDQSCSLSNIRRLAQQRSKLAGEFEGELAQVLARGTQGLLPIYAEVTEELGELQYNLLSLCNTKSTGRELRGRFESAFDRFSSALWRVLRSADENKYSIEKSRLVATWKSKKVTDELLEGFFVKKLGEFTEELEARDLESPVKTLSKELDRSTTLISSQQNLIQRKNRNLEDVLVDSEKKNSVIEEYRKKLHELHNKCSELLGTRHEVKALVRQQFDTFWEHSAQLLHGLELALATVACRLNSLTLSDHFRQVRALKEGYSTVLCHLNTVQNDYSQLLQNLSSFRTVSNEFESIRQDYADLQSLVQAKDNEIEQLNDCLFELQQHNSIMKKPQNNEKIQKQVETLVEVNVLLRNKLERKEEEIEKQTKMLQTKTLECSHNTREMHKARKETETAARLQEQLHEQLHEQLLQENLEHSQVLSENQLAADQLRSDYRKLKSAHDLLAEAKWKSEEELETLSKQTARLSEESATTKRELALKDRECAELQENAERLDGMACEWQGELRQLKEALEHEQRDNRDFIEEAKDKEHEYESELAGRDRAYQRLQTEHSQLVLQRDKLNTLVSELRQEAKSAADKLAEDTQVLNEEQTKLTTKLKDYRKEQIQQLERIRTHEREEQKLLSNLKHYEEQQTELLGEIQSSKEGKTDLLKRLSDSELKSRDLSEELNSRKQENSSMEKELTETTSRLKKAESESSQLKNYYEELENLLLRNAEEKGEITTQKEALSRKLALYIEKTGTLTQELDSLKTSYTTLQHQSEALSAKYSKKKETASKQVQALERASTVFLAKEEEFSLVKREAANYQEQLQALRQGFEEEIQDKSLSFSDQTSSLETELESHKRANKELARSREVLSIEFLVKSQELEQLRQLRKEYECGRSKFLQQENQLSALKQQISGLETERSELILSKSLMLEHINRMLEEHNSELSGLSDYHPKQIQDLTNQLSVLRTELAEKQCTLDEQVATINSFRGIFGSKRNTMLSGTLQVPHNDSKPFRFEGLKARSRLKKAEIIQTLEEFESLLISCRSELKIDDVSSVLSAIQQLKFDRETSKKELGDSTALLEEIKTLLNVKYEHSVLSAIRSLKFSGDPLALRDFCSVFSKQLELFVEAASLRLDVSERTLSVVSSKIRLNPQLVDHSRANPLCSLQLKIVQLEQKVREKEVLLLKIKDSLGVLDDSLILTRLRPSKIPFPSRKT